VRSVEQPSRKYGAEEGEPPERVVVACAKEVEWWWRSPFGGGGSHFSADILVTRSLMGHWEMAMKW